MGVFSDFRVSWEETEYVIPKERIMGAIEAVEDVVTFSEVHEMLSNPKKIRLQKIAKAFGELLRYAGARITDEQVYNGMFAQGAAGSSAVAVSLWALQRLMIPDDAFTRAAAEQANGATPEGNGNRRARRAAASSSRKPSKRPASLES